MMHELSMDQNTKDEVKKRRTIPPKSVANEEDFNDQSKGTNDMNDLALIKNSKDL